MPKLPPQWRVDKLRLLAIRAVPPEIAPGETAVIERLLVNPRTTERDVVQLAARRPSKAPVLMEIYKSKKWMTRYTVKRAVARNPYAPVNLAKNIIPSLQVKDLSDIEDDGSLHSELRDEARALIARKRKQTYLM